jgi:hypothetical protein
LIRVRSWLPTAAWGEGGRRRRRRWEKAICTGRGKTLVDPGRWIRMRTAVIVMRTARARGRGGLLFRADDVFSCGVVSGALVWMKHGIFEGKSMVFIVVFL